MADVSVAGDYNPLNNTSADATASNAIQSLSSQVSMTQTGFTRNRTTGVWSATMFTNLTAGVTMANNTGVRNDSPYVIAFAGTLAPGASASFSIQFLNPSNGTISFAASAYSGLF